MANNILKTLDGFEVEHLGRVWEIGVTVKGVYMPTLSVFGSMTNPVLSDRCWKQFDNAQKECDKRNSKKINQN